MHPGKVDRLSAERAEQTPSNCEARGAGSRGDSGLSPTQLNLLWESPRPWMRRERDKDVEISAGKALGKEDTRPGSLRGDCGCPVLGRSGRLWLPGGFGIHEPAARGGEEETPPSQPLSLGPPWPNCAIKSGGREPSLLGGHLGTSGTVYKVLSNQDIQALTFPCDGGGVRGVTCKDTGLVSGGVPSAERP